MFYLGGMTLGYFVPPAPKPRTLKEAAKTASTDREATQDREPECEQPWARAFVAPWHLFY